MIVKGGLVFPMIKMDRAKVHLDEIEREHTRLIREGMYTITKKDQVKKHRHVIRLETKSIPSNLVCLVGEFAYCLRASLDQLAWQLAIAHIGKRPRSATSFPIRSVRPDPSKGLGDAVKDLSPAVLSIIESLQPYHSGTAYKSHPLYILNELCITDKHFIAPVNSAAAKFSLSGVSDWSRRDFHDALEITVSLSDKFKVQVNEVLSEVVLGEPMGSFSSGFEVVVTELRPIYDFVRNDVVPRFAGFFK